MSKQVIVFPRGQLTPKDRERLTKTGFVAVEADTPHQVVTVLPGAPLMTGEDLTLACLHVLQDTEYGGDSLRSRFAKQLAKIIVKRNEPTP